MAQAKSGDTVTVHYTGRLDDGYVFDTSANRNPLKVKIGQKAVMPAFEQAIIGMEQGESKTVKIQAEEAFGRYREELIRTINRSVFPANLEPKVGQRLTATCMDGRTVAVTVTNVSESSVTIDANHPLAGEDLTFDIELVKIL
ncbi:MAG: peptidylprolyl isomerase [Sedimentisphaerales bacterium]